MPFRCSLNLYNVYGRITSKNGFTGGEERKPELETKKVFASSPTSENILDLGLDSRSLKGDREDAGNVSKQ